MLCFIVLVEISLLDFVKQYQKLQICDIILLLLSVSAIQSLPGLLRRTSTREMGSTYMRTVRIIRFSTLPRQGMLLIALKIPIKKYREQGMTPQEALDAANRGRFFQQNLNNGLSLSRAADRAAIDLEVYQVMQKYHIKMVKIRVVGKLYE